MKRSFLLFSLCFLILQTASRGQPFIQAEIGVKSNTPSFIYGPWFRGDDNTSLQPIYTVAISRKKNFPDSKWFWELGLKYWHTRAKEIIVFKPPQTIHDPYIPPSGEYKRQMIYGGLNIGAGYSHPFI